MKNLFVWILAGALLAALPGCGGQGGPSGAGGTPGSARSGALKVLSGSENKSFEPILKRFGQQNGVDVQLEYLGSVDTMLQLERGAPGYDAVWPANSLWIDLGDKGHIVKHQASIMRSPVVFGVKKSVAAKLGWV